MAKLYLNAEYGNPRTGVGNVAGDRLWINATVKRGSKPLPPTVRWFAERDTAGADDVFIADPTFNVPGGQGQQNTWWAEVGLPDVTGLRWRFRVERTKAGKPVKTITISTEVVTWKRYFIDVEADDNGLYNMFSAALADVKAAFAEAHIEVVENRVKIGDDYKRFKSTDKSTKGGRQLGDVFTVRMHRPALDRVAPTLHVVVNNGVPNCSPPATIQGNDLVITLNARAVFDDELWIKEVSARPQGGQDFVSIRHWGEQGTDASHAQGTWALKNATVRTADNIATVKLDHACLQNTWNQQANAWSTPRQLTMLQALAQGPVEIDVTLAYDIRGAYGGQNIMGQSGVDTYIDDGAAHLAAVVCHELGHACGLVRPSSHQKYLVAQQLFDSNAVARVAGAVPVANNAYYDATFGGSGTHCSLGAQQQASCITDTRLTYGHQIGQYLCLMYHASAMGPNGLLSNGVRFCAACIRQLRGL